MSPTPRRVVTVAFLADVLEVVLNLAVALFTGSAVVFAEMAMGLADVVGSGFLVVGERRARRPRDARHPLGYGREAFFWALLSALCLLVLGGGLAVARGWLQLVAGEALVHPGLAVAVTVFSLASNGYAVRLAVANLAEREGGLRAALRSHAAPLVKTSLLSDVVGCASAVVGLIALGLYTLTGSLVFDGAGAIAVGLLTAVLATLVIAQARGLIAGRSVPETVAERLRDAVRSTPGVVALNRFAAVHAGGEEVLVDVDLDLEEKLDTTAIEGVIDAVQARVRAVEPAARTVRVDLNSPGAGRLSPAGRGSRRGRGRSRA